jgi:hypothetical protein
VATEKLSELSLDQKVQSSNFLRDDSYLAVASLEYFL